MGEFFLCSIINVMSIFIVLSYCYHCLFCVPDSLFGWAADGFKIYNKIKNITFDNQMKAWASCLIYREPTKLKYYIPLDKISPRAALSMKY